MWSHKLQELTRRQETAMVGAVLIIGALAAHNWVVSPHVASLRASQQYQRVTSTCIDRSEEVNHQLRAKRARLQKLLAENAILGEMVFSPAKAEEFLSDFEAFCKAAGCTVGSLSYINEKNLSKRGSEEGPSSVVTKSAALMVYGSYGGIVRLVEKLQSRTQKVWIDALRMAVLDSSPNGVACQLVVTIYVNNDMEGGVYEQVQVSQ